MAREQRELKVTRQQVGGTELLSPSEQAALAGEQEPKRSNWERYAQRAWQYAQRIIEYVRPAQERTTLTPAQQERKQRLESERRVLFQHVDNIFDEQKRPDVLKQLLGANITIQGKTYSLDRFVGAGGYGAVFGASLDGKPGYIIKLSQTFDRDYLNKPLPPDASEAQQGSVTRARSAVVEISSLHHLDSDEPDHPFPHYYGGALLPDPDHKPFTPDRRIAAIVMEEIDGADLNNFIQPEGELARDNPEVVLNWVRQLVEAVAQMHEQRVLHLDLKPDNVMVQHADGRLRLVDFGAAQRTKFRDKETNLPEWTQKKMVLFTPTYVTDAERNQVTIARDIYSLGVVIEQLLYGKPSAEQLNDALKLQSDRAELLGKLPEYLQTVGELAKKMTVQDPTQRIDMAAVQQTIADLPTFEDAVAPAEAVLVDEEEKVA
ncbi:MAG: Serine/threonine-protein kinase PrkC [uncultured bacterium]|nr:MAG: Serine/threonine-protein kinase PrkC [uncultured bacterium]HBY73498.1 hypothetical protein [Candidatus Kerfeldbacteria bacterium]